MRTGQGWSLYRRRATVGQKNLEDQAEQDGRQEPLPQARPFAQLLDGFAKSRGTLAVEQGALAEASLQLLATDRGLIQFGGVDVDGERTLLGLVAIGQPHQVVSHLVRLRVMQSAGG